jgi:hypothetical protein
LLKCVPGAVEISGVCDPAREVHVALERSFPQRQTREEFRGGVGHWIGREERPARHERAKKKEEFQAQGSW